MEKNTHLERQCKKIILLPIVLLGVILMINIVLALEFDNTKEVITLPKGTSYTLDKTTIAYNPLWEKYKPIEINNAFGLGEKLFAGVITEHTETCGIDCHSNIQIYLANKDVLIQDIRFYTINGKDKIEQPIRSYQFYIKTSEKDIEVNDYEWTCTPTGKININGTEEQTCENKLVGTHTEKEPLWIPYTIGEEVEAGTYEIKLEGQKKPTRDVDWQIKTNGVWTTDWAVWGIGNIYVLDNNNTMGGASSVTNSRGVLIEVNQNFTLINVTRSSGSTPTTCYVAQTDFINIGTQVATGTFVGQNCPVNVNLTTTQRKYVIYANSGGGAYNRENVPTGAVMYSNSYFNWSGGLDGTVFNVGNDLQNIKNLTISNLIGSSITLNSPINNYVSPSNSINFNCSATVVGGATLTNMSLWHNGTGTWTRNKTTSLLPIAVASQLDYASAFGITLDEDVWQGGAGGSLAINVAQDVYVDTIELYLATTDTTTLANVSLQYSNGTYISSNQSVIAINTGGAGTPAWYNFTIPNTLMKAGENYKIRFTKKNDPHNLWWATKEVSGGLTDTKVWKIYSSKVTSSTQNFTTTLYNPTLWTCQSCDSDGACGFASENRTVSIDTNAPQITIIRPTPNMNYGKYGSNETLNWSITDTNFANAWYNYNGTNISLVGIINSTQFNLSRITEQNLTFYANDSVGNLNITFLNWTYKVFSIQESYPTSILEGSEGTFLINITSSSSSIVPYLIYDGTAYLGTAIKDGNNYYISNIIDIPTVTANTNKTFYWSMLLSDASIVNTTATNLTVLNFAIDNCTLNSNKIITFLLKDEETTNLLSGESRNIETDFSLYSTDNLLISTYHTQWTNQSNVSICINSTLIGEQYKYDMVTTFSVDNYVVEYWYADKEYLNASLIPITINLMDLLASDSTSFLFNFFDSTGLAVDNIIVHTWRKYVGEGIFREVERSKQNEDGDTIVHLVEEDVIYYFTITKDNLLLYTSETYTALCQAVPCSITLNEGGAFAGFEEDWDLVDNGGYLVSSNSLTRLVTLNFSTTTPSTFNLTVYKLDSEGNLVIIGSSQTTSLEDSIDVLVPLISGNQTYFASVYQNGEFKRSFWINFNNNARTYIGNTLSIFIAVLIILSLGLLAVSEGSGTIIFILMGLFLTAILGLVNWNSSGVVSSILVYLIVAGGLIIWKVTKKDR